MGTSLRGEHARAHGAPPLPKIGEIFGRPPGDGSEGYWSLIRARTCPFSESECDGGGNRSQTKIDVTKDAAELLMVFGGGQVLPGVCSIAYEGEPSPWVVCPRRLFNAVKPKNAPPVKNRALQPHEKEILLAAGLPTGVEIGVWAEVYLRESDLDGEEETLTNYHFDFLLAPLVTTDLGRIAADFSIPLPKAVEVLAEAAKVRKVRRIEGLLQRFPDLSAPLIIEVMTASTSGSNTERGTNIGQAFTRAVLGMEHEAPGINKRQVWGRMISQFFAKSRLAESWGGRTVWVVQDRLMEDLRKTTLLDLDRVTDETSNKINVAIVGYEVNRAASGPRPLRLKRLVSGDSGLGGDRSMTFADILLPSKSPDKLALLRSVLRRDLAAVVELERADQRFSRITSDSQSSNS